MTREEAKEILEEVKTMDDSMYQYNKAYLDALNMAIEALKQEPCNDCISRKSVEELISNNNDKYGYSDRFHEFTEECMNLPPVQPKQDWIPVSERLPEEGINPITQDYYEYQCTIYLNEVYDLRFLRFGKGHWWNGGWLADDYVIAWMERPEPYKENKE